MQTFRIARVEKLIGDLKYPDENELQKLEHWEAFCKACDLFAEDSSKRGIPNRWWNLLRVIAALIEDAMKDST